MSNLSLPQFKVPAKSKTHEWAFDVARYAANSLSMYTSTKIRNSIKDKIINFDLYNGIVHPRDVVKVVNPLSLDTIDNQRELQHYPIAAPLIDLHIGEEINKPFEPLVQIINNVAIEEKQARKKAYVSEQLAKMEQEFQGDQADLKTEMKKLQRKLKYTYKDIVEKKASALLNHYFRELEMDETFIEGYRRMFNTGEEVYSIEIVNGEPKFEVVNSAKLRLYGGGSSNRVEDHDISMIEDHYAPGKLIDIYGSKLKNDEVDRILDYQSGIGGYDEPYGNVSHEFVPQVVGELLGTELSNNYVDQDGNIRHCRVRWRAYKQVKKIAYIDPATETEQLKTRSDSYRLKEGESVREKIWIYDWWIATLIGADILVDAHAIPIYYPRAGTVVEGHCGLVGEIFNINERKVTPVMSRMKPYQYLYDVIMDNIIIAMSKNIGPILEMDMAKKPVNWDTKKWLKYMTKYNVKFVDSFKEVAKGPAQGQLAGNLASGKDQLVNLDFGNYIQQLINLAEYLETAMSEIIGVTPQRKGATTSRETKGGIERATSQSYHMTAWYSYKHNALKIRALNVFIEAAKHALKDNPKKLQNIVDGATRELISVTQEDLINADLGVFATNNADAQAQKQILEQSAQAYMQNGGSFAFIFDVLFSESMSEKRRLIEEEDEERKENQANAQKVEQEQVQSALQADVKKDQDALQMRKYEADLQAKVDIKLKEMDILIASAKNQVVGEKTLADYEAKIMKIQADIDGEFMGAQATSVDQSLKNKELDIKQKEIAARPQTPSA